jgi:hypothetical protein
VPSLTAGSFWFSPEHSQIRLHQLLNQIHLLEILISLRSNDIQDRDDILMSTLRISPEIIQEQTRTANSPKVLEELDLTEGTCAEHCMVEWGDTFYGNFGAGGLMNCGAIIE